jgi:Fe-S oxidoreductase
MKENEIIELVNSCIECEGCLEVCDTYAVTQNLLQSPMGRLKIVNKAYSNSEDITNEEIKGIYTCTLCGICDQICQKGIPIADLIHSSKIKFVELGIGPLDIHKKITLGITEKNNSVGGNPEERLDWIPDTYRDTEQFEKKESDTLLFFGCMSSFRVKESASASYELLKKANYDFKIYKEEPCCGEYVYSSGDLELAKKIFLENFESFKKNGIKTIITTCGGCIYAFNNIYPKYIDDWDIKVKHIVQIVNELYEQKKLKFKNHNQKITYHDPCRVGRKLINNEIYDEPRILLRETSEELVEISHGREFTTCCGAGSGIRGVDSSITIRIGQKIFDDLKNDMIISSCPLCIFNFRYVNYKTNSSVKSKYITEFLLEALE